MTTGKKIAALRRRHGISQEELAHQMNVSRQAVSKWENDSAAPTNDNLIALAGYFGVTVSSFLDDEILSTESRRSSPDQVARQQKINKQIGNIDRRVTSLNKTVKGFKLAMLFMAMFIVALVKIILNQCSQINELNNMKNNYINTINGIYTELNNIRFLTSDPDSYSNYFQYSYFDYTTLDYDYSTNVAQVSLSLTPDSYSQDEQARFVLRNNGQSYSFDAVMENDSYTATGAVQCAGVSDGDRWELYSIFLYITDKDGKTKCYPLYDNIDFAIDYRFRVTDVYSQSNVSVEKGQANVEILYEMVITCSEKTAPQKMVLKIYADNNKNPIYEKGYSVRYSDWGLDIIGDSTGKSSADGHTEAIPEKSTHSRASWNQYNERFNNLIKNDIITPDTIFHAYIEFTDATGYTFITEDLI